jgi:hypothetical protein
MLCTSHMCGDVSQDHVSQYTRIRSICHLHLRIVTVIIIIIIIVVVFVIIIHYY